MVHTLLRIIKPLTGILKYVPLFCGDRGRTVVKVLCYKSEGRWFDPTWCQWIFDRTMALGSTQPLTEMSTRSNSWRVKAAGA